VILFCYPRFLSDSAVPIT